MRFEFARPQLLYLLFLLPAWWLLIWPRRRAGLLFTRGELLGRHVGWWGLPGWVALMLPRLLRSATLACLIVALAEPLLIETTGTVSVRGRGIGLAIDLSSSMLAVDAQGRGNRLDVARQAAIRFAQGRPDDELSLVAFAGQAATRVPPTMDANLIVKGIESLEVQLLLDGTDLANGLLAATSRLVESRREPRVIILLTDGAHNGQGVQPLAAARAAAALGVKVHTISILGPNPLGGGVMPGRLGDSGDKETVLAAIAALTGGKYFAASSPTALDSIYAQINRIEAPIRNVSELKIPHSQRLWPLIAGLLLLAMEVLLRGSRWGIVP